MTQYWAIAVGINQYSNLSPLDYAEQDAAALYDYWVSDAKFPPDHCHLLTASAQSERITRGLLLSRIEQILQQAAADDLIWFTFSGYGTEANGEDYCLLARSDLNASGLDPDASEPDSSDPDASKPDASEPDAITLNGPSSAVAVSDIIALFATTQAQPVLLLDLKQPDGLANGRLGKSSLALAQAKGISLILGCQPDQRSQETFTLGQGLFTAALLESLRGNGVALAQLAQDLKVRLPRLSDRHWREPQTPMVSIPEALHAQLLAPGEPAPASASTPPSDIEAAFEGLDSEGLENVLPDLGDERRPGAAAEDATASSRDASPVARPPKLDLPQMAPPRPATATIPAPTPQVTPRFPADAASNPAAGTASAPQEADSHAWRRLGLAGVALLALLVAGVMIRNRDALFGEARPRVVDTVDSAAPEAQVDRQVNAEILAQAIASLNQERVETPVNQATDFARAIAIAQRIQPGQPLYKRSQGYIRRWGNTIIDLAEARAQSGNYVDAIGAARLVPPSVEAVYPRAEKRIQQWQQQLGQGQQQSILMTAQTLIDPAEASSYSEAIAHLRLVTQRDVDYDQARSLIDRWSTNILDLAYRRAYEGQFSSAIDAAMLVPQDAPAYLDAREAIADWQWQLEIDASASEPIWTSPGA